jgi:hypothetical protein
MCDQMKMYGMNNVKCTLFVGIWTTDYEMHL